MHKKKLFKISTVPCSLDAFLKGQLKMLSEYYEVVAVSSPGQSLKTVALREGIRTIELPMERHISLFKDFIALFRLILLFIKEKPDIVHSMTPKAGLLSMVAAWITRVPIRIHTFTGLVFPTSHGFLQKVLILMDKITCYCATYINPEGNGVKSDLQKFNITRKPLHVIANGNVRGIDLQYYSRTDEVLEKAKKYRDSNVFTFCFIGRLVRDKGVNELVEAFAKLNREYTDIRLILVGPEEKELDPISLESLQIIASHPSILSVGMQNDVRPFLAVSDAFVFPSYREGFPNVVLEAGALGVASIVTDINGSNEIIIPQVNGAIIPTHDVQELYITMKHWYENPELVRSMGIKSREIVSAKFEQKIIWDSLLFEYERLSLKK